MPNKDYNLGKLFAKVGHLSPVTFVWWCFQQNCSYVKKCPGIAQKLREKGLKNVLKADEANLLLKLNRKIELLSGQRVKSKRK